MKIIESPREGMQGFHRIIPTEDKIGYIGRMLDIGFDTVETGSIVSPKLIPQMADSIEVLNRLPLNPRSHVMMLAVNRRGADIIAEIPNVSHLSYPFSFSSTFLRLNVNATVEQSFETVEHVAGLCRQRHKIPVIYISMAFGNPYGDPWSIDLLIEWVGKLYQTGIRIIPLSNVSTEIDASLISKVFSALISAYPDVEFGLHLHTANHGWFEKVEAAWEAGCRRFDGVMNGWGGCPMAGKELLGNLKTENLILFAEEKKIDLSVNREALLEIYTLASKLFTD